MDAVDVHLTRAHAALDAEAFERAFAAFEAAAALLPHSPRIQQEVQRAVLRRAAARPVFITEAAVPQLLYLTEFFKDDSSITVERLVVEAHLALGRGEGDTALKKLVEANAVARPDYPHAMLAEAAILRVKGDKLAAVATFDKAVAAAPKNLTALDKAGLALLDYGQPEEALKYFKQALAIVDTSNTRTHAAEACMRLDRRAEAEEHLKRAEILAPQQAEPVRRLAKLLHQDKRLDEAKAALLRVLTLQVDAWTCFELAMVLQEQGQHTEALPLLAKALSLEPTSHAVAYHVAISAQALGDQVGLEAAANRYLQLSENVPGEEVRRKELLAMFGKGAARPTAASTAPPTATSVHPDAGLIPPPEPPAPAPPSIQPSPPGP